MKDVTLPEVILLIILVFAACGLLAKAATTQSPALINTPTLKATEPVVTELPVAIESPVAMATVGVPVTGAVTVQVINLQSFGPALVDGQGHSLYVFTSGKQYQSPNPCVGDECLEEWSPLLTTGAPVAGAGVNAALLGTVTRSNGTTQVTYNGWPLYYLNQDKVPGDALGQGDENEWYLLSPSGDLIKSRGHQ